MNDNMTANGIMAVLCFAGALIGFITQNCSSFTILLCMAVGIMNFLVYVVRNAQENGI